MITPNYYNVFFLVWMSTRKDRPDDNWDVCKCTGITSGKINNLNAKCDRIRKHQPTKSSRFGGSGLF